MFHTTTQLLPESGWRREALVFCISAPDGVLWHTSLSRYWKRILKKEWIDLTVFVYRRRQERKPEAEMSFHPTSMLSGQVHSVDVGLWRCGRLRRRFGWIAMRPVHASVWKIRKRSHSGFRATSREMDARHRWHLRQTLCRSQIFRL